MKRNRKRDAEGAKLNGRPVEDEVLRIQKVIYELAAEGLIYDTGERRWTEETQSYRIVWAAVPGKQIQS
jgi:hypothetical protein